MILTCSWPGKRRAVDEPFAVEEPRRLLQQRNTPPVVFNQVIVVGGKDIGDIPFLHDRKPEPEI